jgi:hypothetical protein
MHFNEERLLVNFWQPVNDKFIKIFFDWLYIANIQIIFNFRIREREIIFLIVELWTKIRIEQKEFS